MLNRLLKSRAGSALQYKKNTHRTETATQITEADLAATDSESRYGKCARNEGYAGDFDRRTLKDRH